MKPSIKVKTTVEKIDLDNLAQVYMLWCQYIDEVEPISFVKHTDHTKRAFLSELAQKIGYPYFIGRAIRKGRKIVGFIFGHITKHAGQITSSVVLDDVFMVKECRGIGAFKAALDDLILDSKIIGCNKLECLIFEKTDQQVHGMSTVGKYLSRDI